MDVNLDALEVEWISVLDQFNKMNAKYRRATVSRPEFMLLNLIAKSPSGAVKISELATALGVSVPAVSKLLKLLEGKHAIERVSDITDRRITYIAMTGGGRTLYNAALQEMRTVGLRVVEQVGAPAYRQFFEDVQRMYDAFEAAFADTEE